MGKILDDRGEAIGDHYTANTKKKCPGRNLWWPFIYQREAFSLSPWPFSPFLPIKAAAGLRNRNTEMGRLFLRGKNRQDCRFPPLWNKIGVSDYIFCPFISWENSFLKISKEKVWKMADSQSDKCRSEESENWDFLPSQIFSSMWLMTAILCVHDKKGWNVSLSMRKKRNMARSDTIN